MIAEFDGSGEPLAFVRLDARGRADGECTISINVAPAARGRGLGTATLDAASVHAAALGLSTIEALIRPSNAASVRAFENAGYVHTGSTTVDGQPALRLVRRLRD